MSPRRLHGRRVPPPLLSVPPARRASPRVAVPRVDFTRERSAPRRLRDAAAVDRGNSLRLLLLGHVTHAGRCSAADDALRLASLLVAWAAEGTDASQ